MKVPVLKSLFNKVAGIQACNSVKKKLQHRCFPVNIAKFLRTAFFTEQLRWLLLQIFFFKSFYKMHRINK